MTDVLLFHHALGLTPGVEAFADELRAAGHNVVVPDLYAGATYDSLEDGVAHAERVGFEAIADQGAAFADGIGDRFVAAGFSLGVLPAQRLAQTHPGVVGAILYHGAIPISAFGDTWPEGVAVQLHLTEDDPWSEEDLEAARAIATEAGGELFLYPGSGHLVTDSGFSDYDPEQTALILKRTLAFLEDRGTVVVTP
jgi:dienelactone hydrolase